MNNLDRKTKILFFPLTILALMALISCSSQPKGHLDKIDAMSHITQGERVLTRSLGIVYPDSFEISVSSIAFGETGEFVQIVATDNFLYFMHWREDAKLYVPAHKVKIKNINKIKIGTYFGAEYVAIQTLDFKFYAFVISGGDYKELLGILQSKTGLQISKD